jgi:hypothetical protein
VYWANARLAVAAKHNNPSATASIFIVHSPAVWS